MTVPQEKLLLILLGAIIVGIFLGGIYDFFRIRRIAFSLNSTDIKKGIREKIGNIIIFFEDVLYALICSVVVCIYVFYMNSGRFRGLAFVGFFLGFLLYYNTVGKVVMICSEQIVLFLKKVFRKIYRIFFRPLLHIVEIMFKITVVKVFLIMYTRLKMHNDLKKANNGLHLLKI